MKTIFFRNGLLALLLWFSTATIAGMRIPLFDAHLHYNEDVHAMIPPERALELMTGAGIQRAIASSTPGPAIELLYRLAPERVVPFLRPYFTRAQRYTWFRDPELPSRLRAQLDRLPYRGIGEFHVSGTHADSDVVRAIIRIAQQRQLVLHAHTDLEGLGYILSEAGGTTVIWAHAGFDVPVDTLRSLLDQNPRLFLELSFREGITEAGQLVPEWSRVFSDHPRRFLVGLDTYSPGRWAEITDLASGARSWLAQLPAGIAEQIAYGNAERLFAGNE